MTEKLFVIFLVCSSIGAFAQDDPPENVPSMPTEPATSYIVADTSAVPPVLNPDTIALATKKECESTYNINELVYKIQSGFPAQLKDCSATLAKDMALAMSPFGKKGVPPEPVSFMKECTIGGIKKKLPDGAEEYLKPIEKFLQNVMNAASAAGGGLDVKKLSSAIAGLNVNELINELKTKAANDECVVNEPYEPSVAFDSKDEGGDSSDEKNEESRKVLSLGFRTGFNFSHVYEEYYSNYGMRNGALDNKAGFLAGLVFDIAANSWFHFQPGIMYIRKGAEYKGYTLSLDYIEFPVLVSFKFSVVRLNTGTYLSLCTGSSCGIYGNIDYGISYGGGFDIGNFYIGMFYDYGLTDVNTSSYSTYNRTLGFNLGYNL